MSDKIVVSTSPPERQIIHAASNVLKMVAAPLKWRVYRFFDPFYTGYPWMQPFTVDSMSFVYGAVVIPRNPPLRLLTPGRVRSRTPLDDPADPDLGQGVFSEILFRIRKPDIGMFNELYPVIHFTLLGTVPGGGGEAGIRIDVTTGSVVISFKYGARTGHDWVVLFTGHPGNVRRSDLLMLRVLWYNPAPQIAVDLGNDEGGYQYQNTWVGVATPEYAAPFDDITMTLSAGEDGCEITQYEVWLLILD